MAAFLSADQVREMVAQDVEMIEEENETILVDKIKNCLEKVATPVAMGEWGPHSHKHKLNMADFILNMPLRFFARVFGNPAGDPVLLKSRGVTLLRDNSQHRRGVFCKLRSIDVGASVWN